MINNRFGLDFPDSDRFARIVENEIMRRHADMPVEEAMSGTVAVTMKFRQTTREVFDEVCNVLEAHFSVKEILGNDNTN